MAVLKQQFDSAVRRQVFLERLKASQVKEVDKFLRQLDRSLRRELSKSDLTSYNRTRFKTQLNFILMMNLIQSIGKPLGSLVRQRQALRLGY